MSELTPLLRDHLDLLREKALKLGVNVWDVFNEAGLLFTEDRRRAHRAHALRVAIEVLETRSVPQLVGEAYHEARTTPRDMQRGIVKFLEAQYERELEGRT